MDEEQHYKPAIEGKDAISTSLRNIKVHVNATDAAIDLIPALVLHSAPPPEHNPNLCAGLNNMLQKSKPVVEAATFLRVYFENLATILIQEERLDLIKDPGDKKRDYPLLPDGIYVYPFLKIENSTWKKQVPEWWREIISDCTHFRMISDETCVDILATLKEYEWKKNN